MRLTVIDWETLGLRPDTKVIAVAAVTFNLKADNADFKMFTSPIGLKGQEKRSETQSTIDWWGKQSEEARRKSIDAPMTEKHHILRTLDTLIHFISNTSSQGIVGNGINFDNAILSNLCIEHGIEYPTPYWSDHDLRTMKLMANVDKLPWPKELTPHVALDDALHEALCARYYWETLHAR